MSDRRAGASRAARLLAVCVVAGAGSRALSQAPAPTLADVSRKFGVRVVTAGQVFPVATRYGAISGAPPAPAELAAYGPILASEFSLYPAEFVRKTGLQRIVVCRDLAFAGQRRTAVPDFEHDTLYLDAARGSSNSAYVRKVIHHEFFHIVDYKDDGQLYADPEWSRLNPAGFRYGAGGKALQDDSTVSLVNDKRPGFLNAYSASGVEEDKAEIFANLMVNARAVEERARRDPVIAAKVAQMKRLTGKFCPAMNGPFWDKVRR